MNAQVEGQPVEVWLSYDWHGGDHAQHHERRSRRALDAQRLGSFTYIHTIHTYTHTVQHIHTVHIYRTYIHKISYMHAYIQKLTIMQWWCYYLWKSISTYIHTYSAYIHTYKHTYIHTYTHSYTHAYIFTHTYMNIATGCGAFQSAAGARGNQN